MLSKPPSYGFYSALCSFLSSFLSSRSISAVVDGQCSTTQPINSGVPQGSVLSPTLFLLFINDLLSLTNCPIHSYADDTTMHYSTSFDRHPNHQELQISRTNAAEHLTSDLSVISDWERRNLGYFNASKAQFLHLSTRQNLQYNYPLFFNNTQLSLSLLLNSLGLSCTSKLNKKFHSSSLAKSASARLGVLYRLHLFFSLPNKCLQCTGPLSAFVGSMHAMCGEVQHKDPSFFLVSSLLPLQSRRDVASLSIFYRYCYANCSSALTNCMPPLLPSPRYTRLSSQADSCTVQTPYARVNQYRLSFFPFTGALWNSLPASVFPPLYYLNAFKRKVSRHFCNQK